MKKTFIVLLILIFLLFFTLFRITQNSKKNYVKILDKNNKNYISKIEIRNTKGEKIVIVKSNNIWILEKPIRYPADKRQINYMINLIEDLELKNKIKYKKNDIYKYRLDEKNAIVFKYYISGNLAGTFLIGDPAPGYMKNYILTDNKIFIVEKELREAFNIDLKKVKSPEILSFNPSDIEKIKIIYHSSERVFTKKNEKWYENENEIQNINTYLSKIKRLKIDNFKNYSEVKECFESGNIYLRVELNDKNMKKEFFEISLKDKKIGKSSNNGEIYFKIFTYNLDAILNYDFKFKN